MKVTKPLCIATTQTDRLTQTDRHRQRNHLRENDIGRQRHRLAGWFKCQTFFSHKWSTVVFMGIKLGSQRQISVGVANDMQLANLSQPVIALF